MLRWDPWAELSTIQRDLSELFARAGDVPGRTHRGDRSWVPAIDMFRDEGSFVVRVDVAGVKPEDVDVEVHDGVLTIKGERKFESKYDQDQQLRIERHYGRFERQIALPEGVEPDKVEANYTDGVLEVRVPQPVALAPHKVQVQGGRPEAVTVGSNSN